MNRSRKVTIIVSILAVFIMLTGGGFIGVTYYVGTVEPGQELKWPDTTTLYYADGSEMLRLGEKTRYPLEFDEINDATLVAIVASEDNDFWTHPGVDFAGIIGAAWNNFTGGDLRGASTITQQYARLAYQLEGTTYNRKIKEAILAYKMDDQYSKEQILAKYLSTVPLGRGTYGIEAAAKAYFGPNKTVRKDAPVEQQVTLAEAMALAEMAKQPEADAIDPIGAPGYDPTRTLEDGTVNPTAVQNAKDRWEYVRGRLEELAKSNPSPPSRQLDYTPPPPDAYPLESFKPKKPDAGLTRPVALVKNHVLSELTYENPASPFNGWAWDKIIGGGYKIYTTIDKRAQKAADNAADRTNKNSPMYGQRENLQAALVAVEPGTGRVLAYHGGSDGSEGDYAGIYFNDEGEGEGYGRWPPGSSMKVYTLAAALKANISLQSYWEWEPHPMPYRTEGNEVRNASYCNGAKDESNPKYSPACSLLQSTIDSLNVPFYQVTLTVGASNVLALARDAGVDYIWNDIPERIPLVGADTASVTRNDGIGTEVGFGQYAITVVDHANGMATMANNGNRAQAHFVEKVTHGTDPEAIYSEKLETTSIGMTQQQVDNLDYALSKVGSANVSIGWATAGKTGTWQCETKGCTTRDNSHAWMVGYTKKIGVAVWVGDPDLGAIKTKSGGAVYGSGLPAEVWRQFMRDVTAAINWKKTNTQWNPPANIGYTDPPGSVPSPTPSPTPPQDQDPCEKHPDSPGCQIPPGTIEPTADPGDGGGTGGGGGDHTTRP